MKKKALTTIGWLISIVLLVLLFAKLDTKAMWHGFTMANWWYLVAAAAINLTVIGMKAVRWQWLMRPTVRTRFMDIFKATMIGLAANNVLPARGGDVLKIYLISKWDKISKTVLASILGMDKIFEGLTILILFGAMSLHSTFPEWVQKGTLIVSIIITVMLAVSIMLLIHHRRTPTEREGELGKFSLLAKRLGSGLGILSNKWLVLSTLLLSLVICTTQIFVIWCCQMAFGQQLDIWVPVLVYVAINLAIIVPSAPSGVGPFEVAAVLAYSWLGTRAEIGFDIALMYHAIQFIPITLIGATMYFFFISKKKTSNLENAKTIISQEE